VHLRVEAIKDSKKDGRKTWRNSFNSWYRLAMPGEDEGRGDRRKGQSRQILAEAMSFMGPPWCVSTLKKFLLIDLRLYLPPDSNGAPEA